MSESQNIEYKQSWRDEYLKWICGFANANGGSIFLGKDDNGKVVGVVDAKRLLEEIPNKVRDTLGILVDVNLHTTTQGDFIEILVDDYPYPVNYKGQYHYRSGSTKQELKGTALDKFLLQKKGKRWDVVPVPKISVNVTDAVGSSVVSNVISLGACLIYGTKIITNTGEKNIEDIQVDEFILDKDNCFTMVTFCKKSIVDKAININNGLLISSEWHIHLVKLNDTIIEKQAEQLVVGDLLIDRNNNEITIDSLVTIFENTNVVNISTESKTYIANGILTHNKAQCPN